MNKKSLDPINFIKKLFLVLFIFFLGYYSSNFVNSLEYFSNNSSLENLSHRLIFRTLDGDLDSDIYQKIEYYKDQLPENIKNVYNFAYSEVKTSSFEKNYVSHSQINNSYFIDPYENDTVEIAILPHDSNFSAFDVYGINGYFLRDEDTEFKIISAIDKELENKIETSGKIILYTDLLPCDSCDFVIKKFLEKYPNISIEIIHS